MRAVSRKWLSIRRGVQLLVVLLFLSPLYLVEIEGNNFFFGSLSSSQFAGIRLSDPLAALQVTLASKQMHWGYLGSAIIILFFYLLISGRVFCSWICPVNTILETSDLIRRKWKLPDKHFNRFTKIYIMVAILVLSFALSIPVFEVISPIAAIFRNIIFGVWGLGMFLLAAILLFDLFVSKRGWCRYFCPVGGFYQLIGRYGLFRVKIDAERCVQCQKCKQVCFAEPSILDPAIRGNEKFVAAGDCSLCGACVDICPHKALHIGLRSNHQPVSVEKQLSSNQ